MIFCGGEEKLRPGLARASTTGGRSRPIPSEALRRLAPARGRGGGPGRRAGAAAARQAAAGGARAAPGPALRGARAAARPAALRAGRLRRAEAGGDRHRQAHRQDRRGRPLGRAAARARRRSGDRLHGPRRARPSRASAERGHSGSTELLAIADAGGHAASDYLEDAVLAGVRTVGCRRVGGGLAGAPAESNVPAGAALAASLRRRARSIFEGSGACIPPVEVDRTVCMVGAGRSPSRSPSTGCCAPTSCWRREGAPAPPGRAALRAAARAGRAAAGRRAGGAVHDRRAGAARASSRSWPPRTWPAAARWPPTSSAPPPRAATSTSPSSRRRRSTRWPARARREGARVVFLRNRPVGRRRALVELPAGVVRRGPACACETIVVHKGHGLPYSKGLMAQALSATALGPRARVRAGADDRGAAGRARRGARSTWTACTRWPRRCCARRRGRRAVRRYRALAPARPARPPARRADRRHHGVGKSTLATMLAARLGVNRVIATDVIRQVLRAFFTHEAMPTVHHSAFEAGGIAGYRDQAERVGTGDRGDRGARGRRGQAGGRGGRARGAGRRSPARARALRARRGARGRATTRSSTAGTSRCGPGRGPAERYLRALRGDPARSRTTSGSGPGRRAWP